MAEPRQSMPVETPANHEHNKYCTCTSLSDQSLTIAGPRLGNSLQVTSLPT